MAAVAEAADRVVSVGEVIGGKYRVSRFLGKGGMGEVVAAEHIDLRQEKAVKILLPTYSQHREVLTRFKREAQIAANLRSPHAVKVHDYGEDQGRPYLVMELLEGVDLSALVKRRGPLPEEEAIDYVLQACHALAEAHDAGIIHRDLKPANLFLAKQGQEKPCLKVLDFGIARLTDPRLALDDTANTRADSPLGSPRYMSPEHIESPSNADARADIWSLGVVLYHLVSAHWPFEGSVTQVIYANILHVTPKPIVTLRPDISPSLERIIARCLQKKPAARFQTIQELVAALGKPTTTSTTPIEIESEPQTLTAPLRAPQPMVVPSEPMPANRGQLIVAAIVAAVIVIAGALWVIVFMPRQTIADSQPAEVNVIPTVSVDEHAPTAKPVIKDPPPSPTQPEPVRTSIPNKKKPAPPETRSVPLTPAEVVRATTAPEDPTPPSSHGEFASEPPSAPKPIATPIVTTSVPEATSTTTQKDPKLKDMND